MAGAQEKTGPSRVADLEAGERGMAIPGGVRFLMPRPMGPEAFFYLLPK